MLRLSECDLTIERRAEIRASFQACGFARITDFLLPDAASAASEALQSFDAWSVVFIEPDGKPVCLDSKDWERSRPNGRQPYSSNASFQYLFKSYPLVERLRAGCAAGVLRTIAEYLTNATFRHIVADVTGHREFIHIDGFASRFEAGHFLTSHTDKQPHGTPGVRKVAYSLNLTQRWNNDWGGQTCFWSDHDLPICIPPTYNTLLLFAVPRPHSVVYVPPFARGARLAITGWLHE
ncbi:MULTISPECIES: 2OG-Fe(II) oxygenase [unclassified Bradyrhizobium]